MKKITLSLLLTAAASMASAQTQTSCATFLRAQEKSHVIVPYRYTDEGKETPIQWGLDLAWLSDDNVRIGVQYAGQSVIDIIRTSFRPTESGENGTLSADQLNYVKRRANIIKKYCKKDIQLNLNCDHPSVDSYLNAASAGTTGRGQRWANIIDLHIDAYKDQGLTNFVSISPFNEPDYGWDQGYSNSTRQADMKATCKSLKEDYNGKYDGVRICGGNTLNDDKAYEWWNYLRPYVDEGNTHQLAGNFDNYANFFTKVREAGHHATADELHNSMEAMVGVEYGMQTGIWWGTCEYNRSQFMKATSYNNPGRRLGYAEHRANWTAASVYRLPDGSVQGFGGTSERQAVTTKYDFVALDRPVYYAGQRGREYVMTLPGGTGYQNGQTNAEMLIDIQSGADIMPHLEDGAYKIVNLNSGKLMGFTAIPSGWTSVTQKANATTKTLQWVLQSNEQVGECNYYTLKLNAGTDLYLDIKDWNLNAGADVGAIKGGKGTNEQWYLQYAGNGAFYIMSRFSSKCLEVKDGSKLGSANIQMGQLNGSDHQKWRFIPTNVTPDQVAPATPTNLAAESQSASVRLTWDAVADKDIKSYTILRSEEDNDKAYYTLANEVTTTDFVDNEAEAGHTYYYKVYAQDKSLNSSPHATAVSATVTAEKAEIMHLPLISNLADTTENANHCAIYGDTTFTTYKSEACLSLNGTNNFIQLPYTVANSDELSVSMWVYYRGGNNWQRLFDFGNSTNQYMFLAPNCGSGMCFAIKNGGNEQQVNVSASLGTTKWYHVVVTLGQNGGAIYVNGVKKGENTSIDIKPSDIRPVFNYIGRSQFTADPFLKAYVKDVRIYNYALTAEEVSELTDGINTIAADGVDDASAKNAPIYDLQGRKATATTKGITIQNGQKILKK